MIRLYQLLPTDEFGGNVNKLKRFYKRFGFVENRGKYKDFNNKVLRGEISHE